MSRRLSTSRLMVLIGLAAADMALLRAWIGPKNAFGFLGLLAYVMIAYAIAGLTTSGRIRRFFEGAAITGAIIWVAIFLAPRTILVPTWDHLALPIAERTLPRRDLIRLRYEGYLRDMGSGWVEARLEISQGFPDVQAILLIPPTILALMGGLVAAIPRRRTILPTGSPAS